MKIIASRVVEFNVTIRSSRSLIIIRPNILTPIPDQSFCHPPIPAQDVTIAGPSRPAPTRNVHPLVEDVARRILSGKLFLSLPLNSYNLKLTGVERHIAAGFRKDKGLAQESYHFHSGLVVRPGAVSSPHRFPSNEDFNTPPTTDGPHEDQLSNNFNDFYIQDPSQDDNNNNLDNTDTRELRLQRNRYD